MRTLIDKPNALTRRTIIKAALLTGGLLRISGLMTAKAAATDILDVDTADPVAKALGYVAKTAHPGQQCSRCMQFLGKPSDAKGGCNFFPGKRVSGAGWCKDFA